MRVPFAPALWALSAAFCAACTHLPPVEDIAPGQRPSLASDEAGLWMAMDRAEKELKGSGKVIADQRLQAYVKTIACRLADKLCGDIRVYVVHDPSFNANMAPNGAMQVFTGMLLRMRNEAQLAYVLGHEISHYRRRHSIARWRDIRAKSSGLLVVQIAAAMAGAGTVGELARLAVIGSIAGYSRDQEREADRLGFEMMVAAGYDPREAAKLWRALLAEKEASDHPERLNFFASHPSTEERADTMEKMAEGVLADSGAVDLGERRFLDVTLAHRAGWLRDELRQRDFGRSEVVLDRLLDAGVQPGEIDFFRGELLRLRNADEDLGNAVTAYQEALATGSAPPETHRSLGLVLWAMNEQTGARKAFERYLDAAPGADDRKMIESYIEQLDGQPL